MKFLKKTSLCSYDVHYCPGIYMYEHPQSFTLSISPPIYLSSFSFHRLAERLMEIARRQEIKTDLGAMMALAEKSNNDIRSCLSILHFFKAQNKPISLSDIYRTSIGQKDVQKGKMG